MTLDLDALEAIAREATPGPWEEGSNRPFSRDLQGIFASHEKRYVLKADFDQQPENPADANHIATFDPPTVLALITRVREAEAVIEQARAKLPGPRTFAESMSRDFAGNLWPRNVDADEIAAILATYKTTNQEEP